MLLARRAVAATAAAVVEEGGEVRIGLARVEGDAVVVDGTVVAADAVVFAAGPWLPNLLGSVPGLDLSVPRQEIMYFATPRGDARFDAANHPVWVEYDGSYYGVPSIEGRGFKVAPDWPGPLVDPDQLDRRLSDGMVDAAREYLGRRFPAMADQPVAEGRVCQYELTPDTHFIVDRHPSIADGWIVGGGSGHGFKHAPVVGEYASGLIMGADVGKLHPPDDRFTLRPRTAGVGMRTSGTAPSS